jgi:PAS domain S-box-containing protein
MSAGLPLFPVYLVDFVGAGLMVFLSVVALKEAWRLRCSHPESVLFSYLFWLSMAFVAFSVSRSFGHALRFLFVLLGHPEFWRAIAPVSGGLNTMTFVAVAILTLYYPNVRSVIGIIRGEARALRQAKSELEKAHATLRELNQTLEERVEQRSRELLISEQKFRRLFEGSKDMIFFCDGSGAVSDMNRSGVELLGYKSLDEIRGRKLKGFFVNREEWKRYYSNICSSGFIKDFEARFRRKDGGEIYLIISAEAIRDDQEKAIGCEGIAKDITEYKKMTEKLIYSEKMAAIGQLAAGIAHEVNTPLGIILGYTQMLKDDLDAGSPAIEDLVTIERQTKNCKKIVQDLLSFSRSSKASVESGEVSLEACVRNTVAILKHPLEMDQIAIHLELQEDLPPIVANQDRINQVVLNILSNAHQAIGNKGEIAIFLFREGDRVILEIGDTGPGVPEEIKGRIFDPFFTTKPVGQGTGLGLSVSYGIIQEYNGSIECISPPWHERHRAKGLKTVLRIEFPVAGLKGQP